ncbi:hypothetical protein C483_10351 [Natrialba hulunbeirensis JCM 10989]|uniref:CT1 solute carrier family 6, member 8 n=1 Tax=Natrialba hulunbeirensis JCM 10989 TaxID=1227493 RepID=M0A141_9EURY|nr:hypothetical protein [Natrialba hulunbeirensis]ELY91078.1 hypothetical protein C483_10351 [Natrialba hulunbeirensis JCM 10989]
MPTENEVRDEGKDKTNTKRGRQLVSILRLLAIALLTVGFSGWVLEDGGEVVLESPFVIAFAAGIVCAFASIYLGIFLADGGAGR